MGSCMVQQGWLRHALHEGKLADSEHPPSDLHKAGVGLARRFLQQQRTSA